MNIAFGIMGVHIILVEKIIVQFNIYSNIKLGLYSSINLFMQSNHQSKRKGKEQVANWGHDEDR